MFVPYTVSPTTFAIFAVIAILILLLLSQSRKYQKRPRPARGLTVSQEDAPQWSKIRSIDPAATTEIRDVYHQIQGSWELVSYEVHIFGPVTFTRYPLGKDAKGLIIYAADGYMSAQLMAQGCRKFASGTYHDGSKIEMAHAAMHYLAYSGSYSVGAGANMRPLIRHSVDVSLYPNWLGTTQVRICKLDNNELVLTPDTLPTWKGMKVEAVLKWRKLQSRNPESKVNDLRARVDFRTVQ